ncbi:MAG: hypothetical protein SVV67_10885 [Bacillota bacterium]|nr:hypothetical protein [Bacillota bacterium]
MKIDETEKQLHMQMWEESGMSKIAYARQIGLNPHTFYSWFYAGREKQEKTEQAFVEVMKKEDMKSRDREQNPKSIGITLGNGYNLVVPAGFHAPTLHAVLDVLEVR